MYLDLHDCAGPYLCGGTLIEDKYGNQWAMTAAHCINRFGKNIPNHVSSIAVKIGSIDKRSRRMKIRQIPLDDNHVVFHPDYEGTNKYISCSGCQRMSDEKCKTCTECGPNLSGKLL